MEPNPFKAVLQHRLIQAQWSMSYGSYDSLVSACRKLFFQNVIIPISLMYWDYARLKDMIPHLFFSPFHVCPIQAQDTFWMTLKPWSYCSFSAAALKWDINTKTLNSFFILLSLTVCTVYIHWQLNFGIKIYVFKRRLLYSPRLHLFDSKCSNTLKITNILNNCFLF